jgi:hypothetical protein
MTIAITKQMCGNVNLFMILRVAQQDKFVVLQLFDLLLKNVKGALSSKPLCIFDLE